MNINELKPAKGSKKNKKRVGRGIGSTDGKTCGRGHKGLKSRSGGRVRRGFEGGQMPLQMRLPKVGFNSMKSLVTDEIRLGELQKIDAKEITLEILRQNNLVTKAIKDVKIISSGEIEKAVKIVGLRVTKGARIKIESAGGSIVD